MAPLAAARIGVAGMDARLKILSGPSSGQVIPVPVGKLIIGREEDCHLQSASEFVSRHHCVLLLDEYTLRVRDLGSQNGTFVNDRRIGKGDTILLSGDILSVADMAWQVEIGPATTNLLPEVTTSQPAASSPTLEGTGVFEGDTVPAESRPVVSPPGTSPSPKR